eukprot:TRINITY_DN47931_c0_g1_i1.p2 TRINITY_DN47931_c0_g1~~TRINITY_DN47931_c0_g1_i1.p2  ORF type:complete len:123 (+),score=12.23 TRINITY_DN47931_c0_g1_i1:297-665(+)
MQRPGYHLVEIVVLIVDLQYVGKSKFSMGRGIWIIVKNNQNEGISGSNYLKQMQYMKQNIEKDYYFRNIKGIEVLILENNCYEGNQVLKLFQIKVAKGGKTLKGLCFPDTKCNENFSRFELV